MFQFDEDRYNELEQAALQLRGVCQLILPVEAHTVDYMQVQREPLHALLDAVHERLQAKLRAIHPHD